MCPINFDSCRRCVALITASGHLGGWAVRHEMLSLTTPQQVCLQQRSESSSILHYCLWKYVGCLQPIQSSNFLLKSWSLALCVCGFCLIFIAAYLYFVTENYVSKIESTLGPKTGCRLHNANILRFAAHICKSRARLIPPNSFLHHLCGMDAREQGGLGRMQTWVLVTQQHIANLRCCILH